MNLLGYRKARFSPIGGRLSLSIRGLPLFLCVFVENLFGPRQCVVMVKDQVFLGIEENAGCESGQNCTANECRKGPHLHSKI
jgi:hypothetical protein